MNRLGRESSPYLLQHAQNPVDWYPWGEEAFEAARTRDVPIFLSVGYSTCYWCHVMERESFEDDQVARMMNELFVCVKVDREERPEIDELYMTATQILTGRGGWPMSVFLEPEKLRPFWAGTYFPPRARENMGPGFVDVMQGMHGAWTEQREGVLKQASALADEVEKALSAAREPAQVGATEVSKAASELLQAFDRTHGGFGAAPKFPQPAQLEFLLDVRDAAGDEATAASIDEAVRFTLDRMAVGGLFDQIGGGFHRYCVDATWTVPHFEKMLYDNAQLARLYARAHEVYGDPLYARIARRTCDYVLREMTSESGGFFSAQDAEVEGREGLNYVWNEEQAREALGDLPDDDIAFAVKVYRLEAPNFRDPHHPESPAMSVLRLDDRPDKMAERAGEEPGVFQDRLDRIGAALLRARDDRKQPHLDDKVVAAWNGMMIGALARVGATLEERRYIDAAARAARFVLGEMEHDGALARSWRDSDGGGSLGPAGVLEDYACMISALSEVARLEGDAQLASAAARLAESANERFVGDGVCYDSEAGRSDLFIRPRSLYDGATPCGNSQFLHAMIDLNALAPSDAWLDRAMGVLAGVSAMMRDSPRSVIESTRGLLRLMRTSGADRSRFADAAEDEPEGPKPGFTPVEIYSSTDRVSLEDGAAQFEIVLKIAPGYHINAAEPNPTGHPLGEGLAPLRVGVVGGAGVQVFADYPEGTEYGEGRIRVHEDETQMTIALERAGEIKGRPVVIVTFQACTETECLEPATLELDVAIDG